MPHSGGRIGAQVQSTQVNSHAHQQRSFEHDQKKPAPQKLQR
jgi:hypothetical protein